MSAQTNLRLVNEDTGEFVPFLDADVAGLQQEIDMLRSQLKKAEEDTNRWRWKCEQLQRDREKDARTNARWPDAVRLFKLYCRLSAEPGKKSRSLTWNADRFELVEPFLRKHGIGMCERAIVGRVFDHFSARRANGSLKRFHEWERIFANAKEFEESANRAPLDFVSELEAEDEARAVRAAGG